MKIEARLFELLTGFFLFMAVVYWVCTSMFATGGTEWVGVVSMIMTAGLTLIAGTYFRFVARRVDIRPEDYEDAEVSDGAGELGFFSPGSWWPIVLAATAAMVGVSMATGNFWLLAFSACCVIAAAAGLVFEYHVGPEKH